jgi:hypothetical protein
MTRYLGHQFGDYRLVRLLGTGGFRGAFLTPPSCFLHQRLEVSTLPMGTSPLDVGWLCMVSSIREPSLRLAERIRRKER